MSYAGFDSLAYPGDDQMQALISQTNLRWCGFYLAPAPSQGDTEWMNKYSYLRSLGWGLAPIFVGRQQDGGHGIANDPSADNGRADGTAAIQLAVRAGFEQSCTIYLDIETGGPLSSAMTDYYAAWVDSVAAQGTRPGVYCSHNVASALQLVDARATFWVWNLNQGAGPFASPFPELDLASCHVPFASVWQYAQNVRATAAGLQLARIDLDVASVADPSAASV